MFAQICLQFRKFFKIEFRRILNFRVTCFFNFSNYLEIDAFFTLILIVEAFILARGSDLIFDGNAL